jgi:hypothetical protein
MISICQCRLDSMATKFWGRFAAQCALKSTYRGAASACNDYLVLHALTPLILSSALFVFKIS